MSLTAAQIREARRLLDWQPRDLAQRAKVQTSTVQRAEASAGEPPITIAHAHAIRSAFEATGVEFLPGNGSGSEVRLKKG
jgi:ribosome-binding protein aMBF1 (putative translation factor)